MCLNKDAKPFAISTPRRIALPLLPKVKVNWSIWRSWELSGELMFQLSGSQGW